MIKFIFILFYFILLFFYYNFFSRKECNERCNQWKAWMNVNDTHLKYCKFLRRTWGWINLDFSTWLKVKLEVTRTSIVLNVFGSRRSSDVTRSIFCPNFWKMVTSMLQLDLMNLFVKAWAWFNPIIQWMAILTANTSTTFHRDEWLRNTLGYAWKM